MPRSLDEVSTNVPGWNQSPFDEAICWRGGSEAQYMRHKRRGEEPCKECHAAAARTKEDRDRKRDYGKA